jgi:hypothetical protein
MAEQNKQKDKEEELLLKKALAQQALLDGQGINKRVPEHSAEESSDKDEQEYGKEGLANDESE